MNFLKPIRWHEGMFLRPHHMQRAELYHESMRTCSLRALEPNAWGLIHVDWSEEALDNFTLTVRSLRVVLSDGTLVDVPGNARLPGVSVEETINKTDAPLDVALGVRRPEDGVPQTEAETERARFSPSDEVVYDLDAGRSEAPLQFLQYNLHFFLGDTPTVEGHDTLPLGQLRMTGNPAHPLEWVKNFAAPSLVLAASTGLHDRARAAVDTISSVLREIGHQRGGQDLDALILFQALAASVPVLGDMVRDGQVHPRQVYREMARLAGALFFRDKEGGFPDQIPAYDHQAPGPVFEKLGDLIRTLSEKVVRRTWERLPMQRTEGQFAITPPLPSIAKKSGVQFFLEVLTADTTVQQLITLFEGAKISDPSRISTLQTYRLPGVETEHASGPPPQMPAGQTGTFFRLKIEKGDEWEKCVLTSAEMAVFLLNAPQDLQMNLIMIFPPKD